MIQDLREIKEALKKDPDNPHVLRAVGRYYLGEESYKLAKDHYLQAIKLFPHLLPEIILDYERRIDMDSAKIGAQLSLAGLQFGLGEMDTAILELEEILERNPKSVEAYNVLGKIYIKQEKVDETIDLLECSVQEGIRDVSLIEILASAYLGKGRVEDAIQFYGEVLLHRPGDKHILRVLGELHTRLGNYNQAAECFQAMFSEDPEVSREVIQRLEDLLKKLEGSIYIREILAEIYMRSLLPEAAVNKLCEIIRLDITKLDEMISRLNKILKSYPGHPEASLALGEALRMQGNFSGAAECYHDFINNKPEFIAEVVAGYQAILQLCPEQVLARGYLAEAFLYKNQVKDALQEFERMVKVDSSTADLVVRKCREILKSQPQLLLAHLVLGRAYLTKDDVQRTVAEAEGIIVIDKKFTPAYLLLGEAYSAMKLCRKSSETLKMALSIDPYNLSVQEKYKEVGERELENEIKALKERVSQDHWKVSLHLDLGKLYMRKGEEEKAIRELQFALKDQARAPFAGNLLGCIYRGAGRFDLAAAQFNRSLELAPAELSDFTRSVRFNLGTTYEAAGAVRKALKIYEGVLQEDIDFGVLKKRAQYLKATSLQSMRNKTLLMVISKYSKDGIIAFWGREGRLVRGGRKEELSVSFGQKHNASGFEFYMKGMYKAALEEFQLSVELDGRFASAMNNCGVSLANDGRFSEAKNRLDEAVDVKPGSAILRNNLGVVYLLLGDFAKARKELKKAHDIDPDLSATMINLGDLYYLQGEIEAAIKLYQRIGPFNLLTELTEQRLMYKVSG